MRHAAEYFLTKTGRETLTLGGVLALRKLEKIHTPSRVMNEIDKAVRRYQSHSFAPWTLTLDYIYDSLKNQRSLKSTKALRQTRASPEDEAERRRRDETLKWEAEQQRLVMEIYGGDHDG